MSSLSLIYSNRKVCARYDGQNRRFRLFTTIDPTTRKACKSVYKRVHFPAIFNDFCEIYEIL